jgi:hypothetical protein
LHFLPSSAIIPDMKNTALSFPAPYLEALADAFFGPQADTGPAGQAFFIPKLAVFTAAVGVHLITYAGAGLVRRIHNHFAPPAPPAPPKPTPSLRGTPTPDELSALWELAPRSLLTCLRIGSRLADLEPTLDNTFVFKTKRGKHHRIVARYPGLKGWFKENTPEIAYTTAMHYKKLATRLRQLVGLDIRIPLEWLLPDVETLPQPLAVMPLPERRAVATARRKFLALLAENPKYTHLVQAVEQKLGIMRMMTIRRIQPPKSARGHHRKRGNPPTNSLISRVVCDGLGMSIDVPRSAAFWDAVRKILGERNPDLKTRCLQSDIRAWLNAPLQARHNRYR